MNKIEKDVALTPRPYQVRISWFHASDPELEAGLPDEIMTVMACSADDAELQAELDALGNHPEVDPQHIMPTGEVLDE